MFEKNNKLGFKKNESGHPEGGLPKRVRRSKNRRMIEKMREHEDVALENVGKSVRGEEVEKDCLQSSKWLLEKLVSFSTACAAEEDKNNSMKLKNQEAVQEDEEPEKDEATPKPAIFQLTVAK